MHEHPAASLVVKRQLTRRELVTIAVALAQLRLTPAPQLSVDLYAQYVDADGIEPDVAIAALIEELLSARKVKVCRSKTSNA